MEVPAAGGVADGVVVVYARVSCHGQRAGFDRQVARVTEWVTGQGLAVAEVVREVGSGLGGQRPELRRILSDPSAMVIVVEHRDRLARFGVEHLDAALAGQGVQRGPGARQAMPGPAVKQSRSASMVTTTVCPRYRRLPFVIIISPN